MTSRYKQWGRGIGWWGESERHALAAKGIKSGTKTPDRIIAPFRDPIAHMPMTWGWTGKDFINRRADKEKFLAHLNKQGWKTKRISRIAPGGYAIEAWKGKNYLLLTKTHWDKLEVEEAFIRDKDVGERLKSVLRKPYPYRISDYSKVESIDYAMFDRNTVTKLKDFIHKKFTKAVPDHLENNPEVLKAQRDIQKIDHPSKLKEWAIKHKSTLTYLGLGGASAIIGAISGTPTFMQNVVTGEIVAVGGTLIGRAGGIAGAVLTGMGVMEEAKVIDKDVFKEHYVGAEDITIVEPKPKAFIIQARVKKPVDTASSSELYNTPNSLAEISSQRIPFKELTKKEKDVLFSATAKVEKLFDMNGKKIKFNEKNLQVVKRVGHDDTAYGAHQGDLIQIDRDILSNRDKTEGVLCVIPNTVIAGNDDFVEIQDMNINGHILNMYGTIDSVYKKYQRKINEEIVEIKPISMMPIFLTSNHPVLVVHQILLNKNTKKENRSLKNQYDLSKKEWVESKNVTEKDLVLIPRIKGHYDNDYIDLSKYEHYFKNNKVKLNKFPVNKETAFMLGLYTAEGSTGKKYRTVNFGLNNKKERWVKPLLQMIFDTNFSGLKVKESVCKNSLRLYVCNTILGRFLRDVIGTYQNNVKIPSFILYNKDINILKSFLSGYVLGDGFEYKEKNKIQMATVSKILAYQLQIAYTRLGKLANVYLYHRDKYYHKSFKRMMPDYNIYQVYIQDEIKRRISYLIDENFIYTKVRYVKINNYKGKVYNLSTQSHTYTAGNIIVHNCHEAIHKIYDVRDETRDLENLHIDYLGLAM